MITRVCGHPLKPQKKGEEKMKVKLYYRDVNVNVYLGEVITNRSMTVQEILDLLGIDMNKVAEEQGWDGWDYAALTTETE